MTRTIIAALMLALCAGCVAGPVTEGPVTTRDLQQMGEDEGRKLAELATRNVLARYQSAFAAVWRIWDRGAARLRAQRPSGQLSPEQASRWAAALADELLRAAEVRDDKLATLDRRRVAELRQIKRLHENQIATLAAVVKAWAAQGEISAGQFRAWLDVAQRGAVYYKEQEHIKRLRKEAEEAARRDEGAEE